ncbi:MAG: alpha/beta hydrolase [Burkholderiaceae bacterium]|nr:alpha/beta hydrolase [Burkholderiaceae bacterium]
MPKVRVSPAIELECERAGDQQRPTILMIMGLGMQLTAWPDEMVEGLVARGFSVLRFDNRDAGLSTQIDSFQPRGLAGALLRGAVGWPVNAPYRLHDLAADTVGLLDALGLQRVHVVGASMGGMVAQIVAARYPQRVLSLTSIMSTSGARRLPPPRLDALLALTRRPPPGASHETLVDHYMKLFGVIGSPGEQTPKPMLRARLQRSLARAFRPAGTARQMLAIVATGDRSAELASISAPTLVVHGALDPLVPLAAGRDTARRILGAQLMVVPDMGHDLPHARMESLVDRIATHCEAAQRAADAPKAE